MLTTNATAIPPHLSLQPTHHDSSLASWPKKMHSDFCGEEGKTRTKVPPLVLLFFFFLLSQIPSAVIAGTSSTVGSVRSPARFIVIRDAYGMAVRSGSTISGSSASVRSRCEDFFVFQA